MDILYAPSYQSLIFALENFNTKKVEIITRNESIYKFCLDVEIKCKILKINNDLSIKGLYSYKKYLAKESSKIQNKNIYFFFYAFGTYDMFFIKNLKNNNNLFFKNLDPKYHKTNYLELIRNWKTKKYIVLNWLLYILIYNIKFKFYSNDDRVFLGHDLKKLKKYEYEPLLKIKPNDIKIKKIIKENFDCVYICSGREKDNLSILNEIQKYMNVIGISFAIKEQPQRKKIHIFQGNTPKIKSYIPSELIIYSSCKLILGDYSVSLNKISDKIKTISLFKLFKSSNENWDIEILDNHLTSNNISFPENLEVLKKEIEKVFK